MNRASYRTYRVSKGLIQMHDRKGPFCFKGPRCGTDSLPLDGDTALGALLMMWSLDPGNAGMTDHATWSLDATSLADHSQVIGSSSGDMGSESRKQNDQ